jgi:hypothetical protein
MTIELKLGIFGIAYSRLLKTLFDGVVLYSHTSKLNSSDAHVANFPKLMASVRVPIEHISNGNDHSMDRCNQRQIGYAPAGIIVQSSIVASTVLYLKNVLPGLSLFLRAIRLVPDYKQLQNIHRFLSLYYQTGFLDFPSSILNTNANWSSMERYISWFPL